MAFKQYYGVWCRVRAWYGGSAFHCDNISQPHADAAQFPMKRPRYRTDWMLSIVLWLRIPWVVSDIMENIDGGRFCAMQ